LFRKKSLGPVNENTNHVPTVKSRNSESFEKKHREVRKSGSIEYF